VSHVRLIVALASIAVISSCSHSAAVTTTTAAPVVVPSAAPAPATDSLAPLRQRAVSATLMRISGRENAPAESVFQNVKILKGVPAARFLEIMNDGFGHGLGVGCGFCHVPGQWASDQKPNKDVARSMLQMVNRINGDLRAVPNLPDSQPMVGCITCHRMAAKPVMIGK
jgi:Photosynthetic reaction centre cytochrome C subunit